MAASAEGLERASQRFLRRADAPSTRLAYGRELQRFLKWVPDESGEDLLLDYRDWLRDRGLAATTIRWRTTVVRAFLLFAEQHRFVASGLVGDFKPPKGKSGFAPRVLSNAELRRLIAAPDRRTRRGKRDAAILACLGIGGLRAGEVCRLNVADTRIQSDRIVLHVNGKGRKQRLVGLPTECVRLIRNYLTSWPESSGQGAPMFWCGQPGHEANRLTVAAVGYVVRQASDRAGLPRIHAHALRHTAASLAIEAGEPLHRLRDRLGHSSVLVTSKYLHAR